jgi:hypothetical protein
MHQIIELRDPLYQIARAKFSARKEFQPIFVPHENLVRPVNK